MIEAYAIGVTLSLKGNIGAEIAGVGRQFESLNRIIASSQMAVNELAAGMRGLSRVGRSAAEAWTQAANAMERAARAAGRASRDGIGQPGGGGSGTRSSAPAPGTAMVPWSGNGFMTNPGQRGGGSFPRGPSGGGLVPYGAGGSFAGGAGTGGPLVPYAGGGGGGGDSFDGMWNGFQYPGRRSAGPMPGAHDFALAGAGFAGVGAAAYDLVKGSIEARTEIAKSLATLRQMGMSDSQVAEAERLAVQLQQTVPGISQPGALHAIKDVMVTTQKAADALDPSLMTGMSQAAVVLGAHGKGGAFDELFKAMQGAELRGAFTGADGQPDTAKAAAFIRRVVTTTIQTGGRFGPSEILQLMKSGGLGAAMLGDNELFAQSVAPALSMGVARAGTGLNGFSQQFASGKMSEAGLHLLQQMGLLNMDKVPPAYHMVGRGKHRHQELLDDPLKQYKVGMGRYRLPGNVLKGMSDPETNPREHPYEYMNKVLLPAIDAYNRAQNGAPRDDKDRDAQRYSAAQALSTSIPGGNLLGDVIRNWGLIMREVEANQAALKRGDNNSAYNIELQNNPEIKMQAFSAALQGLMAALGGPIMDSTIQSLNALSGVLNALGNFAKDHPTLTKDLMLSVAAVGGFSLAMAALSGIFLIAPAMWRVASWLGLSGGLWALNAALSMFGVGSVSGLALAAIPAGLRALGSALSALAAPIAAILGALKLGSDHESPETRQQLQNLDKSRRLDGDHGFKGDGFDVEGHAKKMGYAPPARGAAPITLINYTIMDGQIVAKSVTKHIARAGTGPSRGTTGPDIRAGLFGGNQAAWA